MNQREFLLAAHHRHLAVACLDLLSDTYADDPRSLCARWRQFEAGIEAHIDAEERLLLPAFAEAAPSEAAFLRDDHARIRQHMVQLGIEVDLHLVRVGTVRALVDELHRHAAREDGNLYQWAAGAIDADTRERLRASLDGERTAA
ncbi:MAG: hemerythrin domain-containing protein [Deltaproteobacteria bacterium]|nr:hemerythrin domain-containing protein [Deltaproteobacteria bacterium]